MDPHTTDSEDEDDEDFVPGAEDDESEEEGDGKRKAEDDGDEEDGAKPKKRQRNTTKIQIKPQSTIAETKTKAETEKKVADVWEEMKRKHDPAAQTPTPPAPATDSTSTSTSASTSETVSPPTTPKTTPNIPTAPSPSAKPLPKTAATKPTTYTFAGEKVVVNKPKGGGNALDNLVAGMGKKNKLSVLGKSKLDWDKFKTNTGTTEELAHQKKNGYLEKQAFLQRTDERRFEIEKQQRQTVRSANNLKQGGL